MAEDNRIPCQLYLISPPKIEPAGFAEDLQRAIAGGAGHRGRVSTQAQRRE